MAFIKSKIWIRRPFHCGVDRGICFWFVAVHGSLRPAIYRFTWVVFLAYRWFLSSSLLGSTLWTFEHRPTRTIMGE